MSKRHIGFTLVFLIMLILLVYWLFPRQDQTKINGLQQTIDKLVSSKVYRLKIDSEDPNTYIASQMEICFKTGGKDSCYKDIANLFYYQFGLRVILDLFQKNENTVAVFARCHEVTHYLSRMEYQNSQNIAKVYDICTSVCHGGCYHGTIEQYMKDKNLPLGVADAQKIKSEIPKICGKLEDYKTPILFDECVHGIGHGAMFVTDGELPQALKICDNLTTQREIDSCYSGVFMENSSSSTSTDHPGKYVKKADPMYPCNSLEPKYLPLCYRYQSSYFAQITKNNWIETAKLCLAVPQAYQSGCFQTIGTNQVGFTQDMKQMIYDCSLMPTDEYRTICLQGIVISLAGRYRGESQKIIDLCNKVNDNFKSACFKQMGTSINSWSTNPNDIKSHCNLIQDQKYIKWCQQV